jgi:hypothetical protein
MVKGGGLPRVKAVTLRTDVAELIRNMIRIRCAVEIGLMTAEAIR